MLTPAQNLDQRNLDLRSETFFSTPDFVEAWVRSHGQGYRAAALSVEGSGPRRIMHGVQRFGAGAREYNLLAPDGLYSSPGWRGQLEKPTIANLVDQLMSGRAASFDWNVRFDHESLAAELISLGVGFRRTTTSVLHLSEDHERIFAGYSASIRNHIRKGYRRGVTVRRTDDPKDLHAYYLLHLRRADEKGGYSSVSSFEFLSRLIELRKVTVFLVAEFEGRIIAGGIFMRDGCSVFYFHSAFDSHYSRLFPSCVIIDEAVRRACQGGATFFNLGGSNGIAALDKFKSYWGARHELNWNFQWKHPLWGRLSSFKLTMREMLNG
jgi:hypothetical protein